ncbi:MAG: hypothetical protein PHI06_09680 [Desulfobulbaceae bacterium]|nr:hypothetical protein [Desulfobulbaceae bacterium]
MKKQHHNQNGSLLLPLRGVLLLAQEQADDNAEVAMLDSSFLA